MTWQETPRPAPWPATGSGGNGGAGRGHCGRRSLRPRAWRGLGAGEHALRHRGARLHETHGRVCDFLGQRRGLQDPLAGQPGQDVAPISAARQEDSLLESQMQLGTNSCPASQRSSNLARGGRQGSGPFCQAPQVPKAPPTPSAATATSPSSAATAAVSTLRHAPPPARAALPHPGGAPHHWADL